MIPNVCVISVPHSGTQFLVQALKRVGWRDAGLNSVFNAVFSQTPTCYQGHCVKPTQTGFAVELSKHMPVFMPMRHPYRVAESWRRRGMDERELLTAYDHMLNHLQPHVAAFVPVDGDPGVRALSHCKLNDAVNGWVPMDWDTVVGSTHGTAHVSLRSLDPSDEIREICNHPLITEFYDHDHDHH